MRYLIVRHLSCRTLSLPCFAHLLAEHNKSVHQHEQAGPCEKAVPIRRSTCSSRQRTPIACFNAFQQAHNTYSAGDEMTSPGRQKTAERSQFPSLLKAADGDGAGEYGSTRAALPDDSPPTGSERWPTPPPSVADEPFPLREVVILAICMSLNGYALSNLFPYVGMMVKGLLGLETTNEVGE